MKKSIKGAVAATAAAALLISAGGTLAYWNATADLGGGSITSGQLALEPGTAQWTLNGAPVADVSTVRVVPGDELRFAGTYTIVAEGDNLKAAVEVVDATPSGDLLDAVDIVPNYRLGGSPIAADSTITEADNGAQLQADLAVDFPFGESADNSSQLKELNLSDISVTLTQVDATP
ncbi:alternate-type signal peptide domain-containing protein [Naumannella cuiyingiana]|uniref:Alternate signal-mediated exported protein n=1 Tax=Naumannella cuiyingiana TaxID=1347891 RepID=A0A7Z0DA11_9ACTN|nr:alternate-type signal peptide domain-containing protein [Naumannella cuiyingiana]NYI71729.1 alternate signal-mediated exported protein [Naumannella cuiyingiana]